MAIIVTIVTIVIILIINSSLPPSLRAFRWWCFLLVVLWCWCFLLVLFSAGCALVAVSLKQFGRVEVFWWWRFGCVFVVVLVVVIWSSPFIASPSRCFHRSNHLPYPVQTVTQL